ncbi:uncharacterized protein PV07_02824 [Cladophialophora immunda]|uniref:Phytocyanin domain-containing protein n=1 Tax=Cladophialophora immunda TaxID=569365 RepID=A0A0D2D633_9EURO|nr:uncharacterized protein PV07_02824 [Cladophialophora immunda]KIW31154.1 hypothetical protein PV07_02824 [Cladophialophora immunda]OQV00095.1 hypothetical protein CLAIMM_05637 [Cladophialophora immunda]
MSLKTLLVSTLFAASAFAQYGSGGYGGGSYSGSGSGSGSGGWSSWGSGSSQGPPAFAAASCPSGCQPMQTGSAPPMSTQPGQLIVQVVSVSDANGSLKYFPNKVTAPIGSVVQFQFHPKNHTVTESSFADPCKPIAANLTSATRPGLKSGFVPLTGTEPFTPVYNVLVNDTKPIWIYCGQTNHCEKGMAMVINQNDSSPNTIDAYIANAAKIPLVNVTTPPPSGSAPPPAYGGPPPSESSAPPAAPPAESTFAFGGAPPASSSPVAPAQTVAPPSSSAVVAPATFTGAAVPGFVPQSSTGVVGLALGALLALW